MAHMQAAGDVGRRHHDRVGPLVARRIGGETAGALPRLVLASFHRVGAIGLVQHCRTVPQSTIMPASPRRAFAPSGRPGPPAEMQARRAALKPARTCRSGRSRSRMRAAQLGKSAAICQRNGAAIPSARRRTRATCPSPLCSGGPCRRAAPGSFSSGAIRRPVAAARLNSASAASCSACTSWDWVVNSCCSAISTSSTVREPTQRLLLGAFEGDLRRPHRGAERGDRGARRLQRLPGSGSRSAPPRGAHRRPGCAAVRRSAPLAGSANRSRRPRRAASSAGPTTEAVSSRVTLQGERRSDAAVEVADDRDLRQQLAAHDVDIVARGKLG